LETCDGTAIPEYSHHYETRLLEHHVKRNLKRSLPRTKRSLRQNSRGIILLWISMSIIDWKEETLAVTVNIPKLNKNLKSNLNLKS
jgi:hypothetical protein